MQWCITVHGMTYVREIFGYSLQALIDPLVRQSQYIIVQIRAQTYHESVHVANN